MRDLLQTRLSLTDAEVGRVVRRGPLGARATVEPKLQWLQARLDLDDAGLRKIVLTLPPLLGLSVKDNLEPTLEFLAQDIGLSRAELREHVLRIPAILAYSLDKRYRPRVEASRAAGVDATYVLTNIPLTDEKFYKRLERRGRAQV